MRNYSVWKNEFDTCAIIVQVYNKCDLASVQKEFIEKGYIIKELCRIGNTVGFIAYEA